VTSFDIITGMEICFAQRPSSFASVDCMSKRAQETSSMVSVNCVCQKGVCTQTSTVFIIRSLTNLLQVYKYHLPSLYGESWHLERGI